MRKPNPPKVEFDVTTGAVNIDFDPDFEFTPEAAARIRQQFDEKFPARHIMDAHTRYAMQALAAYLQDEAFRRDEMQLRDPLGQFQHEAALKKLAEQWELPAFEENVAPVENNMAEFNDKVVDVLGQILGVIQDI